MSLPRSGQYNLFWVLATAGVDGQIQTALLIVLPVLQGVPTCLHDSQHVLNVISRAAQQGAMRDISCFRIIRCLTLQWSYGSGVPLNVWKVNVRK